MKTTEWNGIERRQSKRWNLKIPLRVFEANTEMCIGHVVDISFHGMRMVSHRSLGEQQTMCFDLEIPDNNGQWAKTPVAVVGVYSSQDTTSGEFHTGCKFLNIEPETLFSVQRLIDHQASFS